MREQKLFSEPNEPGSKVAILMPFVNAIVRDERDDFESYEQDAAALIAHVRAQGREPHLRMRATPADFAAVLQDRSVASVVIRGTGTLSAVATALDHCEEDGPYCYLDWLHFAKMATHLKLGRITMRVCGGTPRRFNPPLPCGAASSYSNIWAPVGHLIHVAGLDDPVNDLIRPVTDADELSYDQIKEKFPLERNWDVPSSLPDGIYVGARQVYNHFLNPDMRYVPKPTPISYPDFESGLA